MGNFLSNAGVTSSVNESLLTGHNIAPSKYAYQVTVKVLFQVMRRAFKSLREGYSEDEREQRCQEWCDKMKKRNPQFQFWHIVLSMEMDYLLLLRSVKSSTFDLYVHFLDKFLPWVSAFDHYNYARWISVHQFDMEMIHKTNPLVYQEFHANGNFVVARTNNNFSSMVLDQRHEPLNKDIKGEGCMVGLTKDEEKFRHWTICSPEITKSITEFGEGTLLQQKQHGSFYHHKDHAI